MSIQLGITNDGRKAEEMGTNDRGTGPQVCYFFSFFMSNLIFFNFF